MKKLLQQALVAWLLLPVALFANELKPKVTIQEVTVFLSGAQVVAQAAVQVPKGTSQVLLADLSPKIDPNSIQIGGLQKVSIASINYNTNFLEKKANTTEIEKLEGELEKLHREIALLRNKIKGLEEEESLLQTNKKLQSEQQNASLETVSAYAKYYREQIARIQTDIFDANRAITKKNETLNSLTRELNKLKSSHTEQRGEIALVLDAPQAASLQLSITYNVSGAGWYPTYDIKAENTQEPIAIHYKANVYQQTGEDWDQVRLTLSTGDPSLPSEKPTVHPHYLNFVNPRTYTSARSSRNSANHKYNPMVKRVTGVVVDDTGLPLPGVNVVASGTSRGTQTDFDGRYTLDVNGVEELEFSYIGFETERLPIYANQMNLRMQDAADQLEEVVITGYAMDRKKASNRFEMLQGRAAGIDIAVEDDYNSTPVPEEIPVMEREETFTNILFKISKRYSIPTSPTEVTTVEINTHSIAADYAYYSAPLLVQNVFLTAKLKEWENLDLLAGEANIYFDGSYAGGTYINPQQTEEELVLSLGIDPALTVERKQINNLKDRSFLGNNRIVRHNYEITLRNNKNTAVSVTLLDRIPISQNKDIKVENETYDTAKKEDKTGVVTWQVNLPPRQTEKRQVSYDVRYPKGRYVNLH